MHSQMHWDGYSLPASQLPYAIPAHPLPPYGYTDGIGMDAALQVAWQHPVANLDLVENPQQHCCLGCMEHLVKLLAACGVDETAAIFGCQVAYPAKLHIPNIVTGLHCQHSCQ